RFGMKILRGIPASPGVIIGTAYMIRPVPQVDVTEQRRVDTPLEMARLESAIVQAIAHLDSLRSAARGAAADILEAQREMLEDPELKQGAEAQIASGFSAEAAITRVAADYAAQLASLPDPYLAARAEDVSEIGRRIVAELRGISLEVHLDRPSILVAQDLSPADMVGLDPTLLLAVIAESGSATGHLAIVAQGLGIPAVVGVAGALAEISEHTSLIVDGESGTVTIAPDAIRVVEVETRLAIAQRDARDLEVYRDRPGITADGVRVEVFA